MSTRLTGTALALTLGLLLSACGDTAAGPGAGKDDVASLASAGPSRAAVSPATAGERPLIRTDTSAADEERMYATWKDCLERNGAPSKRDQDGVASGANKDPAAAARVRKAETECAGKEPEEVWERAKRLDPAYTDKLRDWVTCIRSHGIDAWESDGFLTFESLPPDSQMSKVDDCQDKAFGTA